MTNNFIILFTFFFSVSVHHLSNTDVIEEIYALSINNNGGAVGTWKNGSSKVLCFDGDWTKIHQENLEWSFRQGDSSNVTFRYVSICFIVSEKSKLVSADPSKSLGHEIWGGSAFLRALFYIRARVMQMEYYQTTRKWLNSPNFIQSVYLSCVSRPLVARTVGVGTDNKLVPVFRFSRNCQPSSC